MTMKIPDFVSNLLPKSDTAVAPQPQQPETAPSGVEGVKLNIPKTFSFDFNSVTDGFSSEHAAFDALKTDLGAAQGTAFARPLGHGKNQLAWAAKIDLLVKAREAAMQVDGQGQKVNDVSVKSSYFTVGGTYGKAWMGNLLAAKLAGAKASFLIDGQANMSTGMSVAMRDPRAPQGKDYLQELTNKGITVGIYNGTAKKVLKGVKEVAKGGLNNIQKDAIASMHDKLTEVKVTKKSDGTTVAAYGEASGRNLEAAYHESYEDNPAAWRDDLMLLQEDAGTSEVVDGLGAAHDRELNSRVTSKLSPEKYNVNQHAKELLITGEMMNLWINAPALTDTEKALLRQTGLDGKPTAQSTKFRNSLIDGLIKEGTKTVMNSSFVPDEIKNEPREVELSKKLRNSAAEIVKDADTRGARTALLADSPDKASEASSPWALAPVTILDKQGAASDRSPKAAPPSPGFDWGSFGEAFVDSAADWVSKPVAQAAKTIEAAKDIGNALMAESEACAPAVGAQGVIDQIGPGLKMLTGAAEHDLAAENPYLVFTKQMKDQLKKLNDNTNVSEIPIISNSPLSTDSAITQAFFLRDWPQLKKEFPKLRLFVAEGTQKFHAKTLVADDSLAIGSYNLDLLSSQINSEILVVAQSPKLAANQLADYARDLRMQHNKFVELELQDDAKAVDEKDLPKPGVQFDMTKKMSTMYKVVVRAANLIGSTKVSSDLGALDNQQTLDLLSAQIAKEQKPQ